MEEKGLMLDAKDRKILYQLDVNARQPVSSIAKKTGLSREVVSYRIRLLEKQKVIEGYYAAIDVAKLGYLHCRIFMRCRAISPAQQREIISYGLNYPTIGWITVGEGKWNISFVAYVKSMSEFEKTYDDLRISLGKYFNEHHVSVAFRIYHFRHNYLFGTSDRSYAVLGEQPAPAANKADAKDILILRLLAGNARAGLVELARSAKLEPNSVAQRIRRLLHSRVILGFRPKLNVALLGYGHYKVFLALRNITPKTHREILNYLQYQPNVIYVTKAFGISDMEFEVMLKGSNELYKFMQGFLSRFSDFVADYETVLRYREMVNYLPK